MDDFAVKNPSPFESAAHAARVSGLGQGKDGESNAAALMGGLSESFQAMLQKAGDRVGAGANNLGQQESFTPLNAYDNVETAEAPPDRRDGRPRDDQNASDNTDDRPRQDAATGTERRDTSAETYRPDDGARAATASDGAARDNAGRHEGQTGRDDGAARASDTNTAQADTANTGDTAAPAQAAQTSTASQGKARTGLSDGMTALQRANAQAEGAQAGNAQADGRQSADPRLAQQAGQDAGKAALRAAQHGQAATQQAAQQGAQQAQAQDATAQQAARQQQAAGLAKASGNQPLNVSVTVTDEGATLVSQPRSTLAQTPVPGTAADGNGGQANAGRGQATAALHGQGNANANPQALANAAPQAQVQAPVQPTAGGTAGTPSAQTGPGILSAGSSATGTAGGGEALPGAQAGQTQDTQAGQQAAKATHARNAGATPRQAVVDHVSVQIMKAVKAGVDRIHIQLKPASMGRIDIQLEMSHEGKVSAVITTDNKDTLDLLQKDSKSLEAALKDAGLDANQEDLEFNLKGGENQQGTDGDGAAGGRLADAQAEAEDEAVAPPPPPPPYILAEGRVDIRA